MIERLLTPEDVHEFNQRAELKRHWLNSKKNIEFEEIWDLYYNTSPIIDLKSIKNDGYEVKEIKFKRDENEISELELYNQENENLYRNLIEPEFVNSYRSYLVLQQLLKNFKIKNFPNKKSNNKNLEKYLIFKLYIISDELLNIESKEQSFNYLMKKLKGEKVKLVKTNQYVNFYLPTEEEYNEIRTNDKDIEREFEILICKYYYRLYSKLEVVVNSHFDSFKQLNKLDKELYTNVLKLLKTRNYKLLDNYVRIDPNIIFGNNSYHFYKLFQEKLMYFMKITFSDFAEINVNQNLKLDLSPIQMIELVEALIQTKRIKGHSNKDELYKYICKVFNYEYEKIQNHPTLSTSKVKAKYTNPNSKSRFLERLMDDFEIKCKD